jgi:hypothetical protein
MRYTLAMLLVLGTNVPTSAARCKDATNDGHTL